MCFIVRNVINSTLLAMLTSSCCKGLVCTFGRCEKKSKGDPGNIEYPEMIMRIILNFLAM